MAIDRNSLRWVLDNERLNVHAYPAANVGAAIGRLMHVGFSVTNGYQDGLIRMSRKHRIWCREPQSETFCFIEQDGRVGPMLTNIDIRELHARRTQA